MSSENIELLLKGESIEFGDLQRDSTDYQVITPDDVEEKLIESPEFSTVLMRMRLGQDVTAGIRFRELFEMVATELLDEAYQRWERPEVA